MSRESIVKYTIRRTYENGGAALMAHASTMIQNGILFDTPAWPDDIVGPFYPAAIDDNSFLAYQNALYDIAGTTYPDGFIADLDALKTIAASFDSEIENQELAATYLAAIANLNGRNIQTLSIDNPILTTELARHVDWSAGRATNHITTLALWRLKAVPELV